MSIFVHSGRTEAQSVQYGKEKGIKDRVFARYFRRINIISVSSLVLDIESKLCIGMLLSNRGAFVMIE